VSSLLVARIGRPHGLRGEVTVQVHTDVPERRLAPGTRLATEAPPGSGVPRELTVATSRLHRSIWLVGFEEVPDRTGAEGLRGTRLLLDETVAEEEPEDEDSWYEKDLVGLTAFDPLGEPIGEVTELRTGPQDQLVLRLPDGHEALVPFVHAIVPTVDVEGGRVVVDAPPGLLDLGREEG
jgi:16S rRNA processing protein RimM